MDCKFGECNGSGVKMDFAIGIGPYFANCECHQICPDCNGTGYGLFVFAIGIGPYSTACKKCDGKRKIPN
jgi:DnaJ-class molecular chaperone